MPATASRLSVFTESIIREAGVAGVAGSSFFREPVNQLLRPLRQE